MQISLLSIIINTILLLVSANLSVGLKSVPKPNPYQSRDLFLSYLLLHSRFLNIL